MVYERNVRTYHCNARMYVPCSALETIERLTARRMVGPGRITNMIGPGWASRRAGIVSSLAQYGEDRVSVSSFMDPQGEGI
jgi:hypothetical protein